MEGTQHRHIVKKFDDELSALRSLMLEMGGLVEDQIQRAVNALFDGDVAAAERIVERDREVNSYDVRADEEIVSLLALRQPMGWDLRMVMSIAKAVTDLERIGDEAEKIARMTIDIYNQDARPPPKQIMRDVKPVAALASNMLRESLDSFARLDVEKAVEIARLDQDLDSEFKNSLRAMMTYIMEDSRIIGQAMHIVWVIKALERIGDHCKNISEYVVFLVKGKDVRHVSPDAMVRDVLEH